jgi:predicted alpha/beta-hydrolase family hydrolase
MTSTFTSEPLTTDGDPAVRGRIHRPAGDPSGALVLTHGAGSDHGAPLLVALADAFAASGITVLRCDLPFRQRRAKGPPSARDAERDRRGLAVALEAIALAGRRRLVGGVSYGGRQASVLVATSPTIADGLLLLSYPLHPPGKLHAQRTAHLGGIRVPTLFVHGTKDPFGSLESIEAARGLVPAPTALLPVPDAGHGLRADAATAREIVTAFGRLL